MITPLILGHGSSGRAISKAMAILNLIRPELDLAPPVWLARNAFLNDERKKFERPVLCIANPHGLHAQTILDAEKSQFPAILCEKPACVNLEELKGLREVKTPTAILHVYRQTWGVQALKAMMEKGDFGEVISIEGRYWQASAAERVLQRERVEGGILPSWKDDPALSGGFDTYLDLGTHWVDAVSFLYGTSPLRMSVWRSHLGADTPHRDSHVQLALDYPCGRAFGSISKIIHGATNHFEINVIGSKRTASWNFLKPDELEIGEGRDRRVVTRKDAEYGSRQAPHHGLGWLEGYIEIASALLDEVFEQRNAEYPRLPGNLDILEVMLKAAEK